VVGYDFEEKSVATDKVLEDKLADSAVGFASKHSVFGIVYEGAASLTDILESTGDWEVHRVEIDFREDGGWHSD
ncbi:hypothetical protein CPC08DRAFT_609484, partial [Agrocybe pediades]